MPYVTLTKTKSMFISVQIHLHLPLVLDAPLSNIYRSTPNRASSDLCCTFALQPQLKRFPSSYPQSTSNFQRTRFISHLLMYFHSFILAFSYQLSLYRHVFNCPTQDKTECILSVREKPFSVV